MVSAKMIKSCIHEIYSTFILYFLIDYMDLIYKFKNKQIKLFPWALLTCLPPASLLQELSSTTTLPSSPITHIVSQDDTFGSTHSQGKLWRSLLLCLSSKPMLFQGFSTLLESNFSQPNFHLYFAHLRVYLLCFTLSFVFFSESNLN